MKEKKSEMENKIIKKNETLPIINKKIFFFHELIQRTILHVQKNKTLDILGVNDVNNCLDSLLFVNNKLKDIHINTDENTNTNANANANIDSYINDLQIVNNEISSLLKLYGTIHLDDLLTICFGNNTINFEKEKDKHKFELLQKYFHPVSYKVVIIKEKKRIVLSY